MQSPRWALPRLALLVCAHGPPILHLRQKQTLQACSCGMSKPSQMCSDVWTNICFLRSCPSSPSLDSSCQASWYQQTPQKFRPRCTTAASYGLFLHGSPTASKLGGAWVQARTRVVCRHRWSPIFLQEKGIQQDSQQHQNQ